MPPKKRARVADAWTQKWRATLSSGMGCRYCTWNCCQSLKDQEESILTYRRTFKSLSKETQDQELLWIFSSGLRVDDCDPAKDHTPTEESTSHSASPVRSSAILASSNVHDEVTSPSGQEEVTRPSVHPQEETTSSSEAFEPAVDPPPQPISNAPKLPHRRYTQRAQATGIRKKPSVSVQGLFTAKPLRICRALAIDLIGIGPKRLHRVLHGELDGRQKGNRAPNNHRVFTSKQAALSMRFLWKKYHFDAEGLPDRFSFERKDQKSMCIGLPTSTRAHLPARAAMRMPVLDESSDEESENKEPTDLEEEERAIAAMALHISASDEPSNTVLLGPGSHWGPPRYIGVMRPRHLWLELQAWCKSMDVPCPSFHTLLRCLKQWPNLKFRKVAGQHPNCDFCVQCKKKLKTKLSISERNEVIEQYCRHLLDQWLDRAVDGNYTEVSLRLAAAVSLERPLSSIGKELSSILVRADGADQAKFRVPRDNQRTHAFDTLLRPALHVQGCWAHGFGIHLAVADGDMKKDTNNNIEVIARLLNQIYLKHQGMPHAIVLLQDNTSRECNNSLILKFVARLIALDYFVRWTNVYPRSGHSHGPLDGCFGQLCVKLANMEFDDDMDVVRILDELIRTMKGLDEGSSEGALAYKLDNAAQWVPWLEETNVQMTALTGPEAPHSFSLVKRKNLGFVAVGDGKAEWTTIVQARLPVKGESNPAPDLEDVVMVVKDWMASAVAQIVVVIPASEIPYLRGLPEQPQGLWPRRPMSDKDREEVRRKACNVQAVNGISQKACDYLTGWVTGIRERQRRPEQYAFLTRPRYVPAMPRASEAAGAARREFRPVRIAAIGNRFLEEAAPVEEDSNPLEILRPAP